MVKRKCMVNRMPPEKRQHPRINQFIEVNFKDSESFVKAYMTNVGSGGIFLKTDEPFELNQNVIVKFSLPDYKEPITAEGKVVWVNPKGGKSLSHPPGMGIKFIQMSPEDKQRLDEYVAKVLS